ncbi:MAG: hypothetical protein J0I07_03765 [Myxococcales bacterium]|nr:hypothetical protein [Myxococcales bacterium]
MKDLWGYCATCYYADECKAGCTWTADVLFGKPGNNRYCHHRALELKKCGLRERVGPARGRGVAAERSPCMRTAWIDATLSALLGFLAALLAVAARVRVRVRSTQDAHPTRPSFGGWAVAELPDGSSSRLLADDGIDDATRIELAKA